MEQYISKSAVVAEIEKRIKETESMQPKFDQFWAGQISAFKGVLKILDTLEVKEVDERAVSNDLEEVADNYVGHAPEIDEDLSCSTKRNAFIAGAKWQKEQMVKEVDLVEEFADFLEKENAYVDDNNVISYYNGGSFNHTCDIYPIAKHFFELGLKTKNNNYGRNKN